MGNGNGNGNGNDNGNGDGDSGGNGDGNGDGGSGGDDHILAGLAQCLRDLQQWIEKQLAKNVLKQLAQAASIKEKALLYDGRLTAYIQALQLAAMQPSGLTRQATQVDPDSSVRAMTAAVEADLSDLRAGLAELLQEHANDTLDQLLARLDISNANMIDSINNLQDLHRDSIAQNEAVARHLQRLESRLASRSGYHPSSAAAVPWTVINEDDLTYVRKDAIGSGSFGEVYLARWGTSEVAVKKALDAVVVGRESRESIHKEVLAWSRLHPHPNVVTLFGACVDTDRPFLVMKYFPLGNLADRLAVDPDVGLDSRVKWMFEVCLGLIHIHEAGIFHGDLKADNVMLDDLNGSVTAKITDFGLSQFKRTGAASREKSKTQDLTGAVRWKAPESYQRQYKMTTSFDVYAFGMTAYQILTGKIPFYEEPNAWVVRDWIKDGELPTKPEHLEDSAPLWEAIVSCLKLKPEQRATLRQVRSFLETEYDCTRTAVAPPAPPPKDPLADSGYSSMVNTPSPPAAQRQRSPAASSSHTDKILADLAVSHPAAVQFWKYWASDDGGVRSKLPWGEFAHGLEAALLLGDNLREVDVEILRTAVGRGYPTELPVQAFAEFVKRTDPQGEFAESFRFAIGPSSLEKSKAEKERAKLEQAQKAIEDRFSHRIVKGGWNEEKCTFKGLTDEEKEAMHEALGTNTTLKELEILSCKFPTTRQLHHTVTSRSPFNYFHAIGPFLQLKGLYGSKSSIATLAEALKKNNTLESLNLERHRTFSERDILKEGVAASSSLKSLNITENGFPKRGASRAGWPSHVRITF
ncbi:kinase-like domain-containing protein [Zopfochytrium polystomum]|nr:kinase-like domain-containing protein [Zopfochytrium polystomum]